MHWVEKRWREFLRSTAFLLAKTLQYAVTQFAKFAIQEMLAPEERQ